jgi:predicted DCC family thiol-disulfide oxidoreductase YuxK
MPSVDPSPPGAAALADLRDLPPRIVFFDGVCAVCDRVVRWLLAHDERGLLRFAPLQGETAARVPRALPDRFPRDVSTVVYLERVAGETRVALRSRALFRIARTLGGPLRWLTLFEWLPAPLTDLGYLAFVRVRYRVFGKLEECALPAPGQRARFLA